jgi:hypothetical protein
MKHLNGSKDLAGRSYPFDSATPGSNPGAPAIIFSATSKHRRRKSRRTNQTNENRARISDAQRPAQRQRPFPWTFFLTCIIVGIIMAAAVKGALSGPPIDPKAKFMAYCLERFTQAHCEFSWSPSNWMKVYRPEPNQQRRTKLYHERIEPTPSWPSGSREWVPTAKRPPASLFKG